MARPTSFPIGAIVLIDGAVRARVLQHFPKGSSSYMFPHYKLDVVDGDRNVAVAEKRVGVKKAKGVKLSPVRQDATWEQVNAMVDRLIGELVAPKRESKAGRKKF